MQSQVSTPGPTLRHTRDLSSGKYNLFSKHSEVYQTAQLLMRKAQTHLKLTRIDVVESVVWLVVRQNSHSGGWLRQLVQGLCTQRYVAIITIPPHTVGKAYTLCICSVYTNVFNKQVYGKPCMTENSSFSLLCSPKSMSLTYSGNLSVGTGSMAGTGKVRTEFVVGN